MVACLAEAKRSETLQEFRVPLTLKGTIRATIRGTTYVCVLYEYALMTRTLTVGVDPKSRTLNYQENSESLL